MGRYRIFDDVDSVDTSAERLDSFQLEDFRINDFASAMQGELGEVFSDTGGMVERYLPLVSYFCAINSPQYVCPPRRQFHTGSPSTDSALEGVYSDSGIDLALLNAQQQAVGQNASLMIVDPCRQPRQVRVTSWTSAEYFVDGDPMLTDIRDADKLTVRWPVRRDTGYEGAVSQVTYGRRVYTPTEAYLEVQGGVRTGLFNPSDLEDLSNPYGYIPAVGVHLVSAPRGFFKPRVPSDLLSVQLAVILAVTDIEMILRQKAAGREVITGEGAHQAVKNAVNAGPTLLAMEGGDLTYTAASLDPRVDRYQQGLELLIKLWARYRFTSPDGLWASSGITGAAKAAEQGESIYELHRQEHRWSAAERQLGEVVADVSGVARSAGTAPKVAVEYSYPKIPQNDLQAMQATALGAALGQVDLVQAYARANGVSAADADGRYGDNLKRWADLVASWQGTTPPGLDSIATQMSSVGASGRPVG